MTNVSNTTPTSTTAPAEEQLYPSEWWHWVMGAIALHPLELSYFINVASWSLPCLDAWDLWYRMHVECCKYSQQNWIKFVYTCGPVSFPFLSRLTLRFSMLLFTDNIEGRRDAMNPSWTWTPKTSGSHMVSWSLSPPAFHTDAFRPLRCFKM